MPIPLIVGAIVAGGALIGTKTGRSIVKEVSHFADSMLSNNYFESKAKEAREAISHFDLEQKVGIIEFENKCIHISNPSSYIFFDVKLENTDIIMSNIDLYNGNHDYNEDSPCTDDLKRNDSYIDLLGKSQGYIISLYGYESDKLFVDYFSQGSNILIKDKVKEYIKLFKHKAEINDENFRICISRLLISSIYPRQEETFNINMLKNYYYIAAMGVKERTILRT